MSTIALTSVERDVARDLGVVETSVRILLEDARPGSGRRGGLRLVGATTLSHAFSGVSNDGDSRSRPRAARRGLPLGAMGAGRCVPSRARSGADGLLALGDEREDVVAGDDLAGLVGHLDVPRDDALAAPLRVLAVAIDLALARQARPDRVADRDRLDEAQRVEPVVGEHRPRRRRDEEPRRRRQHEVAVRDALAERRLLGRDLVEVHVEEVARDAAEGDDVGLAHRAPMGEQRVADRELLEVLAKRMDVAFVEQRAANVLAGHRRQHRRRALHRRALQEVLDGADAAELLAAAGAARAAVLEHRQRRAVAGRFGRGDAVEDEEAPVPRRHLRDRLRRDLGIVGDERRDQAAAAARGERHRLVEVFVRHQRRHRTERLDVVDRVVLHAVAAEHAGSARRTRRWRRPRLSARSRRARRRRSRCPRRAARAARRRRPAAPSTRARPS